MKKTFNFRDHCFAIKSLLFIILITAFLLSYSVPASGLTINTGGKSIQWQCWEYAFSSQVNHKGRPVNLEVVFTGPGGLSFISPAFTDDGKLFLVRAAFPVPGTWKWVTICSDSGDKGLHNLAGKVTVKRYTGNNPLYMHGDLKVSDNKRYLVHADGKPFLWMGETGWYATWKSTIQEWSDYINIRAGQKFSVIQISPGGSGKKNSASFSETMSVRMDGTPDPLFWQDLDNKIAYANGKGLFILMVGIGSTWRDLFDANTNNQPFESYIAARYAGFMVSFSSSFDQLYDPSLDSVARQVKKFTRHLVTQHPGTNYEANLKYRNTPSVDFAGLQSGHNGGNLSKAYNAARSWTLDMWNSVPTKPVIDIEAMYDAYGNDNAKNWREKDARKLGWIAWLSGSRGYTYGAGDVPPKVPNGAGGVWKFNKDSSAYDYWRKVLIWPSSRQMTIMHDFFDSLDWWQLAPSHEQILNQPEDETLKMVVSITENRKLLVAYLPDNNIIELNLKDFSGLLKGRWFNPKTGKYIPLDKKVTPSARVSFSRPEGWEDSILLLTK